MVQPQGLGCQLPAVTLDVNWLHCGRTIVVLESEGVDLIQCLSWCKQPC